jgi:hypothetical protein
VFLCRNTVCDIFTRGGIPCRGITIQNKLFLLHMSVPAGVPTTPAQIDDLVRRLCKRVARRSLPVYVVVRPEPNAQINECFSTVARRVQRDGGQQIFGWTIWSTPVMVEAEFHAVWKSPSDELIDIAPKANGETQILFLPDPSRQYTAVRSITFDSQSM